MFNDLGMRTHQSTIFPQNHLNQEMSKAYQTNNIEKKKINTGRGHSFFTQDHHYHLDNPDHKQMLLKLQGTKINMSETTGAPNFYNIIFLSI